MFGKISIEAPDLELDALEHVSKRRRVADALLNC